MRGFWAIEPPWILLCFRWHFLCNCLPLDKGTKEGPPMHETSGESRRTGGFSPLESARSCDAERWAGATRVLCVRLDGPAGVIHSGPAIRALREACPGRRITLLTTTAGAAAAALVPGIDETIVYDPPWSSATARDSSTEYVLADMLRSRGFDAGVVFSGPGENALPAGLPPHLAHPPP